MGNKDVKVSLAFYRYIDEQGIIHHIRRTKWRMGSDNERVKVVYTPLCVNEPTWEAVYASYEDYMMKTRSTVYTVPYITESTLADPTCIHCITMSP